MSEHPYTAFERSQLWAVVEDSLQDLVDNHDLKLNTAAHYVVGYLCKQLDDAFQVGPARVAVPDMESKPRSDVAPVTQAGRKPAVFKDPPFVLGVRYTATRRVADAYCVSYVNNEPDSHDHLLRAATGKILLASSSKAAHRLWERSAPRYRRCGAPHPDTLATVDLTRLAEIVRKAQWARLRERDCYAANFLIDCLCSLDSPSTEAVAVLRQASVAILEKRGRALCWRDEAYVSRLDTAVNAAIGIFVANAQIVDVT